ncbi:hypothetical protein [Salinimicrobium flavum]|uniref:Uncharacterized protein n=1 Tax=Salinimicrobium flavum TaxID=1737065 RepID=A0ABW5IVC0_9FLAO
MEELKLIEGQFSPTDAKELLLNLIGSKIQFHTNKNFSTEICTGAPDIKSLEKIFSLRSTRERLILILREAQNEDLSIEIKSTVQIYFTDKAGAY